MSRHEHRLRERESRAWTEVGRTTVRPAIARMLTAVFLLTIFAIPVTQHLADRRAHTRGERAVALPQVYDIFRRIAEVPARFQAAQGGWWRRVRTVNSAFRKNIQEYEDAVEESSLFGRAILPPTQSFFTGVLGAGNEQAYTGRGQWLFYRPDIDHVTGPGFLAEESSPAGHVTDNLNPDALPAPSSEAVVYTFSMRDNQWTDAARWRPGQRVTMKLVPWLEVEPEFGRLNRGELEEDRLLFAEPNWGEAADHD